MQSFELGGKAHRLIPFELDGWYWKEQMMSSGYQEASQGGAVSLPVLDKCQQFLKD